MQKELWKWPAADIAAAIRKREVSSIEVTQSCLERINAVNPTINAIVEQSADVAMEMARAADNILAKGGEIGILHGVPVTIKINADQQGSMTTDGVYAYRDRLAEQDCPAVANLRKAGAIFIGRTNTPAFSWRWFTDNALHGRTLNPWDAHLTPGGSSGGAAAAVATGMGPLAHGSDAGGSIRYPAYACGVVGLRPTPGRVPTFNATAAEERPSMSLAMSVQGPLARSVQDVWLGLEAMAQFDARDPMWVPAPLRFSEPQTPLRVALVNRNEDMPPDATVSESLSIAARLLEQAGYIVEEISLPSLGEAASLWTTLLMNEGRASLLPRIREYGDEPIRNAAAAIMGHTQAVDWEGFNQAAARRVSLMREWSLLLEQYPLMLMPVSWLRPFQINEDQEGEAAMQRILHAQSPLLALAVLGFPGVSVPVDVGETLPGGVQIVAGKYREDICLAAAQAIEAQGACLTPIDPS